MNPAGPTKRTVPPSDLGQRVTAITNVYVIGHFGIGHVPPGRWSLEIGGHVRNPLRIGHTQLRALPPTTVTAVLECFGNPLEPELPTRRAANVTWTGVRVQELLDRAGARPGADSLWAQGLDSGEFAAVTCSSYLKDLPLDIVYERGLVAYEMNAEPLTDEHGFPARLVVPGYFGTNNVKWLRSLTVADHRPEHLFTTRLYLRSEPGSVQPVPVRDLDVNSIIAAPVEQQIVGRSFVVTGWAWSVAPVTRVQVSVDGVWSDATVEQRAAGSFAWQGFSLEVSAIEPGTHVIGCRAGDANGHLQPTAIARNQVHSVTVQSTA